MRTTLWAALVGILLILIARVLSIFLPSETLGINLILTVLVLALFSPFLLKVVAEKQSVVITDPLFRATRNVDGPAIEPIFPWEEVANDRGNTFSRETEQSDFSDEIPTSDNLRVRAEGFISWEVAKTGVTQFNSLGPTAKKQVETKLRSLFKNYILAAGQNGTKFMTGEEVLLNRSNIVNAFEAFVMQSAALVLSKYGVAIVDTGITEIDYGTSSLEDLRKRGAQKLDIDTDVDLATKMSTVVNNLNPNGTPAEKAKSLQTLLASAKASNLTKAVYEVEADPAVAAALGQLLAQNPNLSNKILPNGTKGTKP
jgi:regulator of protease activity HflC (stomatin/prohibitin superfamily)